MAPSRTPQALVVPPRRNARGPVRVWARACLALTGLLGALTLPACQDAPTDPLVGVVAGEAEGALAVGVALPEPSWLAPDEGMSMETAQALEAWHDSWSLAPEEGHAARERLYGPLARALAPTLEPGRVDEALARLSDGLQRARSLVTEALPERIEAHLGQASAARAAAERAWSRGDASGAVEAALRGGDALREVGPEAVARTLQREVEEAFGRVSEAGSYSGKDLERLTRLVHGAREALDEGSWVLAIRRAYYARALLRGND